MTTRAKVELKRAALHTDFAREFVTRRLGQVVADHLYSLLPTYRSGPRKGLVKGYVNWKKFISGGWYNNPDTGRGGVVYPGSGYITVSLPKIGTVADEQSNADDEGRLRWISEKLNKGEAR
jgi:hypothetical protein